MSSFEVRLAAYKIQFLRDNYDEFGLTDDRSNDTAEQAADRRKVHARWNEKGNSDFLKIYEVNIHHFNWSVYSHSTHSHFCVIIHIN
jgi:hypothetical protein